jgi:Uma2 family endonuclease
MPTAATGSWTLEQLHALPDDGNKYELVRGELFVTPAPSTGHEMILARLSQIMVPYVQHNGLGYVFHPRTVLRFEDSEVEPDLMVRAPIPQGASWETAPTPILIVEVLSPTTRRRDREAKRAYYLDAGVGEYWIVDGDARTITVVRHGARDVVVADVLRWHPAAAPVPLDIQLVDVFGSE